MANTTGLMLQTYITDFDDVVSNYRFKIKSEVATEGIRDGFRYIPPRTGGCSSSLASSFVPRHFLACIDLGHGGYDEIADKYGIPEEFKREYFRIKYPIWSNDILEAEQGYSALVEEWQDSLISVKYVGEYWPIIQPRGRWKHNLNAGYELNGTGKMFSSYHEYSSDYLGFIVASSKFSPDPLDVFADYVEGGEEGCIGRLVQNIGCSFGRIVEPRKILWKARNTATGGVISREYTVTAKGKIIDCIKKISEKVVCVGYRGEVVQDMVAFATRDGKFEPGQKLDDSGADIEYTIGDAISGDQINPAIPEFDSPRLLQPAL